MPDQPDDARKRQQRGVFPPFFAPRNGRGETSPTPPSGSWRRVSRLFTPPEVARQRRTPSAPQTPYTPPVPATPGPETTAAPEAFVQPTPEVAEPVAQPESGASETITPPEAQAAAAISPAPLPELLEQPPTDSAFPLELEQAVSDALAEAGEAPASSDEAVAEPLAHFDSMAFDEGADSFVVESLEPEPISLAPSDADRMDVSIESDAVDSLENVAHTGVSDSSDYAFAPGAAYDDIESVESYLADEYTVAEDPPGFEGAALSDDAAVAEYVVGGGALGDGLAGDGVVGEQMVADEMVSEDAAVPADSAAGFALEEQPADVDDPWAGAELPEPAFGSIGWPSNDIAALAAENPVEGVDEMSAALAWNDEEAYGVTGEHAQPEVEANGSDVSGEDALSAMAHELRDSSSVWGPAANVADENADVSARARFYGGGERSTSPSDMDAAMDAAAEGSAYAAELAAAEAAGAAAHAAGDDPGAAIADALARVAARIRAGEVDLPAEVVGASDESALAAALAALLRGPRH